MPGTDYACLWEHIPGIDVSLDDTARQLAQAVLSGDTNAAGPLADRVCEILNRAPGLTPHPTIP